MSVRKLALTITNPSFELIYSSTMIDRYTFSGFNLSIVKTMDDKIMFMRLNTNNLEPTNQNSIKVAKVFEPTNRIT